MLGEVPIEIFLPLAFSDPIDRETGLAIAVCVRVLAEGRFFEVEARVCIAALSFGALLGWIEPILDLCFEMCFEISSSQARLVGDRAMRAGDAVNDIEVPGITSGPVYAVGSTIFTAYDDQEALIARRADRAR